MSAPDELWVWGGKGDWHATEADPRFSAIPTVRYIRAPDSALNGLADEIRAFLAAGPSVRPHEGYRYGELLAAAEAALRNQPGGAVPREPTEEMLAAAEALPDVQKINDVLRLQQVRTGTTLDLSGRVDVAIWRTMHDAATKAGEGQTHADDSDILAARGRK